MSAHTCFKCEHGGNTPDEWNLRAGHDPTCRGCGRVVLMVETTNWLCSRCDKAKRDADAMEQRIVDRVVAALRAPVLLGQTEETQP